MVELTYAKDASSFWNWRHTVCAICNFLCFVWSCHWTFSIQYGRGGKKDHNTGQEPDHKTIFIIKLCLLVSPSLCMQYWFKGDDPPVSVVSLCFLFFLLICCLHCCFFLLFLENGSSGRIPSNFDGGLRMVLWEFIVVFGAFNQESSPNLHRHQKNQKNQTTRCTKPAQAPKKPRKPKPQQLVRKHGHRFGIFSFLGFFGTCAGLVMVALWFLWFFWCLPVLCEVKLTKPAQAPKKPKEPNH